ncbi:hypothetical protein IKS73_01400 [bacterium]|nr:hypothetical protein [bacterium]
MKKFFAILVIFSVSLVIADDIQTSKGKSTVSSQSTVQKIFNQIDTIKEVVNNPSSSIFKIFQKAVSSLQSGDYTYTGKYTDDDDEVMKLTVKVSIGKNGEAKFALTKTDEDDDSETEYYKGTVQGNSFTASDTDFDSDVIKGTITSKKLKGVFLSDGEDQEGSFEATR